MGSKCLGTRLRAAVAAVLTFAGGAASAQTYVEVTPTAAGVVASTQDGNVASNTVDGSLSTRWSGNGDGAWIRYDLGSARTVAYVRIAVHNGNTRQNRFDLQVSNDGASWQNVLTNVTTSGTTTQEEMHDFGDVPARYVRYVGHGNNAGTSSTWNSLTEVSVFALSTSTSPTPTPSPTPPTAATPTPSPTAPATGEITPTGSAVLASAHDGNLPANTVDGSLSTRWSANGDGQWIRYDLGTTRTVAYVSIGFYSGNTRQSRFDLQVSNDGASWSNVLTGALSNGTSTQEQVFDFPDVSAQYVRYLGHGNTANAWNSLTEVSLFGSACTSCPTPGPTPTPTATPSTGATPTPTPTATLPSPRSTPVFSQNFDSLATGGTWLSSCKWRKHTRVTDSCGVTSKCLRIKQDPFCKEPPLFPLPPVEERPTYPSVAPCEVCSPYYTNTGTDVVQAIQPLTLADEYSLNYDLYFEPGYDWARGGKLPGLSAKEWDSGCSIEGDGLPTDPGPARWSVRLMWRANGTNELYVYDQNRVPGACGTRSPTPITFTTGRWYAITIYVKLNTTATSTDGIAGLYIDGQLARQETGLRLRAETSSDSRINQIFFSTFFGGNESKRLYCEQNPGTSPYCTNPDPFPGVSWVPTSTAWLRFDNMAVYPGLRVRTTAGQ